MTVSLYRVRTQLAGGSGGAMLSTFWFNNDTATLSDLRDNVATFWGSLASKMNQNVSWSVENEAAVINSETGAVTGYESDFVTYAGTGSEDNDPLPWATQGLIKMATTGIVNGRQVRGRLFIPGACEEHSNGAPDSGYLGALVSSASALLGSSPSWSIWARPVATGPHTRAGSAYAVSSVSAFTKWAVLRSRRD